MDLTVILQPRPIIPYSHYLPTRTHLRIRKVNKELEDYPRDMIKRRMNKMQGGAATKSDLLGLLLESNFQAIKQGNESAGLSMEDIINECKLFHFAGHESFGLLLVWTTVMLSRPPKWQERAREEVFQVLGKERAPSYDDLSRLKIGSMHSSFSQSFRKRKFYRQRKFRYLKKYAMRCSELYLASCFY
ncbi:secologanin synthase 1-like [Rhododendron vialii]|uniref:secologanin synthase 1-like n=1 Tax=Rhododendron vialii TaxID=182163 RepID=UPI00265EBAEE|nr:secologanin synthase 1-like [Rhododendron vialii]XP_058225290.1 secologanin synthase 1-like [Rhododendron vialii]XP_058225291.1 secologanin synthase 1-like [Rhododendron vialii]